MNRLPLEPPTSGTPSDNLCKCLLLKDFIPKEKKRKKNHSNANLSAHAGLGTDPGTGPFKGGIYRWNHSNANLSAHAEQGMDCELAHLKEESTAKITAVQT